MAGWISRQQQQRDHNRVRNTCAACGREGTQRNPLGVDDEGYRVHAAHFTDPTSGLYGHQQR